MTSQDGPETSTAAKMNSQDGPETFTAAKTTSQDGPETFTAAKMNSQDGPETSTAAKTTLQDDPTTSTGRISFQAVVKDVFTNRLPNWYAFSSRAGSCVSRTWALCASSKVAAS